MRQRFYPFEPKPFHTAYRSETNFYVLNKKKELDLLWQKLTLCLTDLGKSKIVTTHALVLMSNHFHWLWSPFPSVPAENAFGEISAYVSMELGQRPTWDDHVFSIDSYFQYQQVYKYIYRNPVEAGMVARVEDYTYSTLQNALGRQSLLIGLQDPFGIIFDQFRIMNWLNTPLVRQISLINRPAAY